MTRSTPAKGGEEAAAAGGGEEAAPDAVSHAVRKTREGVSLPRAEDGRTIDTTADRCSSRTDSPG